MVSPESPGDVAAYWSRVRTLHPQLPDAVPEAWSFGGSPAQADELLDLVLDGTKTATASALADYEAEDEPLPQPGQLNIVLDGANRPRAVLETTGVRTVPFDQVDAEHAHAEGEGDRTRETWRRLHETFWREHAAGGWEPSMPVVCESFRLLHSEPAPSRPSEGVR